MPAALLLMKYKKEFGIIKSKYPFLWAFLLAAVFLTIACPTPVRATVGIGLKWFTEGDYAEEATSVCVIYGLYNPFDVDVYGFLSGTKDLEPFYSSEAAQLIPKATSSGNAIPTEICFKIPEDVHPKNCVFGMLCERSCTGVEPKVYTGEVVGAYQIGANPGGSTVGTSFAAPYRIVVKCEELKRDYTPLIAVIVAILIIAAAAFLLLRKKKHVPTSHSASQYPEYRVPKKRGKNR